MLVFVLSFVFVILGASGQNIVNARFAAGTSMYPNNRDGLLEVTLDGLNWKAVCSVGFGKPEASLACALLQYPAFGVAMLISRYKSSLTSFVSNVSCSQQTDFKLCSYTTSVPQSCSNHGLDTQLVCLKDAIVPPSMNPLPEPNCASNPLILNDYVQLTAGSNFREGLLQVRPSKSLSFGSVCATNFGRTEAAYFCATQLCSPSDFTPIIYVYTPTTANSVSFSMSGFKCPEFATTFSNCTFNGWYNTADCTAGQQVGLQCALSNPTGTISPTLNCSDTYAIVTFNRTYNQDLTQSMISVDGCTVTASNDTSNIYIRIDYNNCVGPIVSNVSDFQLQFNMTRQAAPVSNIYYNVPRRILLTCDIQRAANSSNGPINPSIIIGPPVDGNTNVNATIKLFTDKGLTIPFPPPYTVTSSQILYAQVSGVNVPASSKLVLQNCWATSTNNPNDPVNYNLIVNRCPADPNVIIFPTQTTSVSFQFKTVFFANSAAGGQQMFIFCNTITCLNTETSTQCTQNCATSGRRRRRDTSSVMYPMVDSLQRHYTYWFGGPIKLSSPVFVAGPNAAPAALPISLAVYLLMGVCVIWNL